MDLREDLKAFDHPAEDGVLAVEVFGGAEGEKELRATGVLAGVGHRERAAEVLAGVRLAGLAGDHVSRPPRATAGRIAPLRHELGDDAVERRPRVEALLDEADEVGDGVRGLVLEQLDNEIPGGGLDADAGEVVGRRLGSPERHLLVPLLLLVFKSLFQLADLRLLVVRAPHGRELGEVSLGPIEIGDQHRRGRPHHEDIAVNRPHAFELIDEHQGLFRVVGLDGAGHHRGTNLPGALVDGHGDVDVIDLVALRDPRPGNRQGRLLEPLAGRLG